MPTSVLVVRMDSVEYSRYYRPLQRATAHVHATGAANGVVVTATLKRDDGYGVVATKTGVIASEHVDIVFDLTADLFDADGIYRGRHGEYHVTASVSDAVVTGNSATFFIMAVPVAELKARYLRGIDLFASNVTLPRVQPVTVTGVKITGSSTGQFAGISTLAWAFAGKTLSWDGGTPVAIDMTLPVAEAVLVNLKQTAYVYAQVTTELLPTVDKTESLVMDFEVIDDTTLREMLFSAYGDVQGRLHVKLEPSVVDTEGPGTTGYDAAAHTDEYIPPFTYYRQNWYERWFTLKLPLLWVLKVHRLDGYFNSSKVATIPIDNWVVTGRENGEIDFVPKQGALLTFVFTGVPSFAFMTNYSHIPSFWHTRLTCGLTDLSSDDWRVRVRNSIARTAAMEALALAGMAVAPGLSGESTSRDGVSESRSYATGPAGRYSQNWTIHRDFLYGPDGMSGAASEIGKLRNKLALYFVTL